MLLNFVNLYQSSLFYPFIIVRHKILSQANPKELLQLFNPHTTQPHLPHLFLNMILYALLSSFSSMAYQNSSKVRAAQEKGSSFVRFAPLILSFEFRFIKLENANRL